jgi:superfamily II DNA helicase RecQ
MRLQFFRIAILSDRDDADELNQFLSSHRVLSVDRQLVVDGSNSFWTVCVTWLEGDSATSAGNAGDKGRGKIDYREVLPEDEFRMFAKLRSLRKDIAEKEEIPAYTVFTNEQLAEMVRQRVTSLTQLSEIAGIGPARIEKYGKQFLLELEKAIGAERGSGPVSGGTSPKP